MTTHDTSEMRNQYFSRVFPFLKDALGDEVDVDGVPLRYRFDQQRCTLDETVPWKSLTVSFRFVEYLSCQ